MRKKMHLNTDAVPKLVIANDTYPFISYVAFHVFTINNNKVTYCGSTGGGVYKTGSSSSSAKKVSKSSSASFGNTYFNKKILSLLFL